MLHKKRVQRIILARPAVEAGERLGFLPGDLQAKVDPYLRPLYDALEDMMPAEQVQRALETRTIEIAPLAYMRGRTLADAFVILDEAQNTTGMQMKMLLTRLGVNSRAVDHRRQDADRPADARGVGPRAGRAHPAGHRRHRVLLPRRGATSSATGWCARSSAPTRGPGGLMGVALAARRHGARVALALLVAVVAYAAFPRSATVLPVPLAVGSVASVDVIAPVGFLVLKPGEVRAREAEALATTVKPLITARPEASDSALAAAGHFFAALDSAMAAGASLAEAVAAAGAALERGDLPALAGPAQRAALRRAVLAALRLSARGFLAPGISTAELGREVVLRRAGDERVVSSDSLYPFGDFLEAAAQQRPERRGAVAEHLYERLLSTFFRPTLVYERAETERRRDVLRGTVDSVEAVVQPGERIIGAHEVVDRAASAKLVAYRAALERGGAGRVRGAVAVLGVVGLETSLCLLFGVICYFFRPQLYQSGRALGFFALGFAVVLVAAGLIARWAPARSELIPVALAAILFSVLFDGRIAAVAAMVLAAMIGVQPAFGGSEAMFLTFLGGAAAALSVQRIRRRTQTYYSIAIVTAVYTIAAVVSGAAAAEPAADIGRSAVLGGVNALVSAALAMLVLPLAERFTRSTTDLTLLELSGPDRPLLRRLATEAPGTYAHSVAMANLCEAACNAIGANGLLARVGCYYHDIGKLSHPLLFAENQTHGKNPHDQLRPFRKLSSFYLSRSYASATGGIRVSL